jgi:cytochrome c-type biogenesis protein CcmH
MRFAHMRFAHMRFAHMRFAHMRFAYMRVAYLLLIAFTLLTTPRPALAVQPDEILTDPALEGRARTLSKELRCMVCQNQSIDDSDAPLARDLRLLVRERLKDGDSDRQVIDFLVARYGEFVLLKPRLSPHTALLWFGPPALLCAGALALFFAARRRSRRGPDEQVKPEGGDLTPAEQARLAELLKPET